MTPVNSSRIGSVALAGDVGGGNEDVISRRGRIPTLENRGRYCTINARLASCEVRSYPAGLHSIRRVERVYTTQLHPDATVASHMQSRVVPEFKRVQDDDEWR